MPIGKSSILKVDDRLYCLDDSGKLYVLECRRRVDQSAERSRWARSISPRRVYADGKIYHVGKERPLVHHDARSKDGVDRFDAANRPACFPALRKKNAGPRPSFRTAGFTFKRPAPLYCFEDTRQKDMRRPIAQAVCREQPQPATKAA